MQPNQIPEHDKPSQVNNDQAHEPGVPSYKKSLKFILLISLVYFGSAALIVLAALRISFIYAWFLMPYFILFPVYIALVSGSLLSTFVQKHLKTAAWIAFGLGLIALLCMILDFRHKVSPSTTSEITTNMFGASGILAITATFMAIRAFKSFKAITTLTILIGLSSLVGLRLGMSRQQQNLVTIHNRAIAQERQKTAQEEAAHNRELAAIRVENTRKLVAKLAELKSPFMIPPEQSEYKIDPPTFEVDKDQNTDKLFGEIDITKDNYPVALTMVSMQTDQTYSISSKISSCKNVLPVMEYKDPCVYLLTTPQGVMVAKYNNQRYFFVKNGSYQYIQTQGELHLSDVELAGLIDSLVPATSERF